MRFHILGIPHTISTPEYSSCAFTQKVVKLCRMLRLQGHHVIHYGHEGSNVECSERVTVTTDYDLDQSYGDHDWKTRGWPPYKVTDHVYTTFYANAIEAIAARKQPGDFLLCSFGFGHKPVADALPDLIAVEPGIGYPGGSFARFRVFESYAVLHAYQGQSAIATARNDMWYDAVIPNAFNVEDFKFSTTKDNYFLFLGRINEGKGIHIAKQIAEATKTKLVVAGQGLVRHERRAMENEYVTCLGVVGPKYRAELLASARAVLCPSTFLEPFCGVQIEAMLSGTPVISSDWGAFAEYNLHGVTGYRCKTFEQFEWAARNVGQLKAADCRKQGERFSLEAIAPMYDEYFSSVKDVFGGKGWYEPRERTSLDKTTFA